VIDFGQTATGIVVNENDWGGKNPRVVRPRRRVTGTVTGLFPAAPNVCGVRTPDGEDLTIRTDLC
jgi:hypothetical protein